MNRYWFPHGARTTWDRPEPGSLVATRRAVFRIVEYRPYHVDQWTADDHERVRKHGDAAAPYHVILRPAHITSDDVRARDHDKHYTIRSACFRWHVYPDEHYPLCATCGEPVPCREQTAAEDAAAELRYMARFETPGVCPACREPITSRQKSRTFGGENLIVPLGPPVTFHTRARCEDGLLAYEDEWVKADPRNRRSSRPPVCKGTAIIHVGTNTYECTARDDCPGLTDDATRHRSMRACGCPEHPGGFSTEDARACNLARSPGCPQHPQEIHEDTVEPGGEVA